MNRKKKIVIRLILLAFIFSLFFFFFKIGYKYYDDFILFGKNYLGIFFLPAFIIIFLDIFFTFINSKKKRILYKTRLLFFIIFTVSVSSVFVLGTLKYLGRLNEADIIDVCIMKYNFGFLITYFITYIFSAFKLNYIFAVFSVVILISLFFLIGKEIGQTIRYFIKCKRRREALKLEKALLAYIFAVFSVVILISLFFLIGKEIGQTIRYFIKCKRRREALKLEKALLAKMQEQIAIKETLEEKKAVEYEKQNIILDTVIKEKVEKAIEKDILPLDKVEEKPEENKIEEDKNNEFSEEDTIK